MVSYVRQKVWGFAGQGKAIPGTGHTSVAGTWMDKAMYIWDGVGIGVSVSPSIYQEKHLMLK